jgi:hypothetical protein
MNLEQLRSKINEFYLESKNREYPNTLLLTKQQYKDFLKELFNVSGEQDIPEGIFIKSIEGLTVAFADELVEPRVLKM